MYMYTKGGGFQTFGLDLYMARKDIYDTQSEMFLSTSNILVHAQVTIFGIVHITILGLSKLKFWDCDLDMDQYAVLTN